jgi:O-methyltransferase
MKEVSDLPIRSAIKRNYVSRGWHKFGDRFVHTGLEYVYLTKFSEWCEAHRHCHFNDYYNPNANYDLRLGFYDKLATLKNLADAPIDYLEFGVASGASMEWWTRRNRNPESRFVGFDTFTGLPESWDGKAEGTFSTQGKVPAISDDRVSYQVGPFQSTLPPFLKAFAPVDGRRKLIHLDADLFSATLFTLISLGPNLKPGDILMFDEFSYVLDEFRAFHEFTTAFPFKYELLVAVNNYGQVALENTG